jgi:very-short-patch-repair endonuclease
MRSRPLNPARAELLANRAREMRAHPTLSEAKLWQALRGAELGVAFRRQAVVGERIVTDCAL